MEMEMRAIEDIKIGQDITPPLPPLSFSLHDTFLHSHCSSCFSPLPSSPFPPLLPNSPPTLLYCSPRCSSLDSPLHESSAELHLLQSLPSTHTSDLRAALRLLQSIPSTSPPSNLPPRFSGLLTNRDKLMSPENQDIVSQIREGAREMAKARSVRYGSNLSNDFALEEAALCLVMTNAVEVQDKSGRILGIAVYDKDFSWINHSCSPNACYRFLVCASMTSALDEPKLRIVPHPHNIVNSVETTTQGESGVCSIRQLPQGCERYGPRIIVRSIKPICKGEEVTVAYADLLKPKAMRQSELWSKYQFVCCCRRCTASPQTYVDRTLEEISTSSLEILGLRSDQNFLRDEANCKFIDCVDEIVDEYLSVGDPESCCKKLENMLTQGLQFEKQLETKEGKLQLNFMLHPLNHVALNAYTTLASAYKIRSNDLIALCSDIDGYHCEAFNMSNTSAAYSLLLAGATHHLLQSETSLIASAATFWANAGEALLTLARSSGWNLFLKPGQPVSNSSIERRKWSKCSLMDRVEMNLCLLSQAEDADFENISNEFLEFISSMTRKVWHSLICGCRHLQKLKDPIDFSWLGKSSNVWDIQAHLGSTDEGSYCETEESITNNEGRVSMFELGVHCLKYGGYLAQICYGDDSYLTCHIQNVLYNEDNSILI